MASDSTLDQFKDYSKIVGELTRQLAFAGLATVWLFKVGDMSKSDPSSAASLPLPLFRSVFFLVFALAGDFLQHVTGSLLYNRLSRVAPDERGTDRIGPLERRLYHVSLGHDGAVVIQCRPLRFLFLLKIASIMTGYAFLLAFLAGHLFFE